MKQITFKYWTDLLRCGCGGNVGGTASIMVSEKEEMIFVNHILPAKRDRNMIKYFNENLPEELSNKITNSIIESWKRVTALDALNSLGMEVFNESLTKKEYESLSESELVEKLVSQTEYDYDLFDFGIVDMEIIS